MLLLYRLHGDITFLKTNLKNLNNTFSENRYNMNKEFLKFEVIEIKTQNFHPSESFIAIDNVDIDNILLSDKLAYKKK